MTRALATLFPLLAAPAFALAFVPLSERAADAVSAAVAVPWSDLRLPQLKSPPAPSAGFGMVRLKVPEPPSADCRMANVRLATVPCPDARRTFPPLRQAQPPSALHRPFLPRLREPPSLSGSRCESILDAMMMAGFLDGTLSPRSPRWRPRLLAMMAGNPTGAAFDDLFRLILRGFPGADDFARARAMRAWASTLPAEEAGEVWRAETRFWLQASEPALAVEAAGRMERARPDYRARACRLKTLAYASSGDFARARETIADGRRRELPDFERMELLYLEAWMDLQDGRTVQASVALRKIVSECSDGPTAEKARKVLESLGETKEVKR